MFKNRGKIILLLVVGIAIFLRFYNLMWGNGYFFHPDEGNIARSVAQMNWSKRLHPDFFAYGQLPAYFAYFFGIVTQSIFHVVWLKGFSNIPFILQFTNPTAAYVTFPTAVFWLRALAATSSVITVWYAYKLSYRLSRAHTHTATIPRSVIGLTAALLTAFTPGLIQAAHFGTTESMLSMCYLGVVFQSLRMAEHHLQGNYSKLKNSVILCGILLGIGLAAKITAVYFVTAPAIALLLSAKLGKKTWRARMRATTLSILFLLLLLTIATVTFTVGSPYHVLSYKNALGTSTYESEVATGKVSVFYTRQFIETIPYLFQTTHIAPYALGLPLALFGTMGIAMGFLTLFSRKSSRLLRINLIVILGSCLVFIVGNGILFVKWTRFLIPVAPLWPVMTSYLLYLVWTKTRNMLHKQHITRILFASVLIVSIIPGIKFFTLYTRPDSRMQSSAWIFAHIPDEAYVLSETANVVDIPFPILFSKDLSQLVKHQVIGTEEGDTRPYVPRHYRTISFNFYELDDFPTRQDELLDHLAKADYIYIPSRRIYANHMRLADRFPHTARYYQALFSGELGFEPMVTISTHGVQERISIQSINHFYSPADIFIEDEQAEESWTVFDHPIIRIYKKTAPKTREEYGNILDIL